MLADGVPLPDHILNAPTLLPGLALYYNAFHDLSSCRTLGMTLGPIPWTAINDYCYHADITGEQRDDMFHHVMALDDEYRAFVEKQSEARQKKSRGQK